MSASVLPLSECSLLAWYLLAWVEREIEMHPSGRRCRKARGGCCAYGTDDDDVR